MFSPRPKSLGSDNFLKLADEEEVTGMFKGEIHKFYRHWANNRSEECPGKAVCEICKADPKNFASFRFRINFITVKNDQLFTKIFEGGGEVYDMLVSLDKKYDFSKCLAQIVRRGVKTRTKYDIIPLTTHPITKAMDEKLKAVTLLKLGESV